MPGIQEDEYDDEMDDLVVFPLTESYSDKEDYVFENLDNNSPNSNGQRPFRPLMTLKQRRRSMLSASSMPIAVPRPPVNVQNVARQDSGVLLSPRDRWRRAFRQIKTLSDPWSDFSIGKLPTENVHRHRYSAVKKKWVVDSIFVKMETEPFNHGAMRACYRLKKLSSNAKTHDWKHRAHNCVAKQYMEDVEREVYFEDVRLQMDAKLWGEEFDRHKPPKKVDVFQMSIIEFINRPGKPLFHLENLIEGNYIKYNSNSGFVEENVRFTPHAFSHFTFERSGHKLIVVDIQGVGDLWTDPQIHTSDGIGYGDGNLGTRGMALFFHSHACNPICQSLGLSKFDLSLSEQLSQSVFIRTQKSAATQLRGLEEMCCSVSPSDAADLTSFFSMRNRCMSSTSSGYSGEDDMNTDDRYAESDEEGSDILTSARPSLRQRYHNFLSESDDSSLSTNITEEEEKTKFHLAMRMNSRPSCIAHEVDYRSLNISQMKNDVKPETSILGEIHHCLAKYHEMGRFIVPGSGDAVDVNAALFHEQYAAKLGVKEAILTLACIYLNLPHSVLESITVEKTVDNTVDGVNFMVAAADAGDRSAMVYMAKAYESGEGLGTEREKSYSEAVKWYEKAVSMVSEDEVGEFDATMDDPVYQLKAAMAKLYLSGGYGLEKDPSYAGELYNEAAESATSAMKGRLANQFYAMAEEAWGLVEE